jgi:catechol 2,3-dioxygenase-like lactoylglutathione lyase family enzyme
LLEFEGAAISAFVSIGRANTILYCARWHETVEFYRSVFGLPVELSNDWFVEFRLTSSSFLSIADAARATIGAVGGQGVTLTWMVPDPAATRTALQERGIEVTLLERRWGANAFYCHDPEGHRIELWSNVT